MEYFLSTSFLTVFRREPFHGDESSNSSQEPDVEFGELQPGEGMSGMFTADESANKGKPRTPGKNFENNEHFSESRLSATASSSFKN